MPSIKAIGLRMKSVLSTAKITKAMKMVAASKLKGAEKMMLQARPFASSINGLMESKLTPGEGDEPSKNSLLLAISSDKVRHVHCACAWCGVSTWACVGMHAVACACAWHVHAPMLALPFNQGLCGGINSRVSKEVKLAIDGASEDAKPKVRAPWGAWPTAPPSPSHLLFPLPCRFFVTDQQAP